MDYIKVEYTYTLLNYILYYIKKLSIFKIFLFNDYYIIT